MKNKGIMALLLCGALTASLFTGCSTEIDKTAAVATYGETEISLGLANFAARLQQAQYDDFYVSYFGEEVWRTDMYGYGTTMEDDLKADVIQNLYEMHALKNHMADYGVEITDEDKNAISQAAEAFISSNSAEAVEALGATTEIVEEYLTLYTIQSRMYDEIIKNADTNVSDEEANMGSYSYVQVSRTSYTDEEGNSVEHTEETLTELAATMTAFIEDVKVNNLESAAEAYGYAVSSSTFAKDSTTVAAEVLGALETLEEGQVSELIETETQYYVVRLDAVTDKEATEQNRQSMIAERQSTFYAETVESFVAEQESSLNENLWKKVSFDNLFTIYPPETEMVGTENTEAE